MNLEKYRNVKIFLIGDLLEKHVVKNGIDKDRYEKLMRDNGVENWQEVLWNKNELTEVNEYATKIVNILWDGSAHYTDYPFSKISETKYENALKKDQQEEQELTDFKNKKDQLQSLVQDYEKGLKAVIGEDELTNWETKITKTGVNDKDLTDLRNKITNLQTAKGNLDKELKEKQQQILDHRCDSPNNTELNQTKEELDKANQEIISLKEQLDKPNNPNPSPNQPNEEEERKEEKENNNLTLEQLKAKLNQKNQEINSLKEQLDKKHQNSNHSNQSNSGNGNIKLFLGIAVGILIVVIFKGLTLLLQKKKKTIKLVYENYYHFKRPFRI